MVAWLSTLKTIAPFAAELVAKTVPAFTSRRGDKTADVVPQQIAELQTAATENADAVKQLAVQLQKAVAAVEEGAQSADRRVQRLEQASAARTTADADLQRTTADLQRSLADLERAVTDLQRPVAGLEARLGRLNALAAVSIVAAAGSLCLALYVLVSRG